jgi:hypothetical protein
MVAPIKCLRSRHREATPISHVCCLGMLAPIICERNRYHEDTGE